MLPQLRAELGVRPKARSRTTKIRGRARTTKIRGRARTTKISGRARTTKNSPWGLRDYTLPLPEMRQLLALPLICRI